MALTVTYSQKFARLKESIGFDLLVQPEVADARDTIVKRIMRQGKGLGAKRNTLTAAPQPLGAIVVSTLHNPRQKGTSWGTKNTAIVTAMGPNVLRKMVRNIQARWAAAG